MGDQLLKLETFGKVESISKAQLFLGVTLSARLWPFDRENALLTSLVPSLRVIA